VAPDPDARKKTQTERRWRVGVVRGLIESPRGSARPSGDREIDDVSVRFRQPSWPQRGNGVVSTRLGYTSPRNANSCPETSLPIAAMPPPDQVVNGIIRCRASEPPTYMNAGGSS